MSARWRKQPSEKGLASVCQGPRGYELRENGKLIIHVSPLFDRFSRNVKGWYWYGLGQNTCDRPQPTKEAAKAEADKYYKDYKRATLDPS